MAVFTLNKKPTGDRSPMGRAVNPNSQHSLLVTATTAKVDVKSGQADVSTAAAVTGTVTRAVPAAMTATVPRAVSAMAGAVAATMTRTMTAMAGTVTGAMASAAGAMTRAVAAAMTRTAGMMMISRLHRSRSENGEAGGDSQESDEFFHDTLGFGLSRCRTTAACKSDATPMRLFSSTTFFDTFDL